MDLTKEQDGRIIKGQKLPDKITKFCILKYLINNKGGIKDIQNKAPTVSEQPL